MNQNTSKCVFQYGTDLKQRKRLSYHDSNPEVSVEIESLSGSISNPHPNPTKNLASVENCSQTLDNSIHL